METPRRVSDPPWVTSRFGTTLMKVLSRVFIQNLKKQTLLPVLERGDLGSERRQAFDFSSCARAVEIPGQDHGAIVVGGPAGGCFLRVVAIPEQALFNTLVSAERFVLNDKIIVLPGVLGDLEVQRLAIADLSGLSQLQAKESRREPP